MNEQSADHTAGSLRLVLCALAHKSIALELIATEGLRRAELSAHQTRTILTATQVWLPEETSLAPYGKEKDTLQLARVAHAAAHLLYSQAGRSTSGLKPMGVAVVSAFEDARVDRLLCASHPGILAWFAHCIRSQMQSASDYFSSLIETFSAALVIGQTGQEPYWVSKACDLFLGHERQYGLEDYDGFRRIASVMANDLGQMRVQFNPQQYVVPVAYQDDHSYLWDFEQTGAEVEFSESVASPARVAQLQHNYFRTPPPEPNHFMASDLPRVQSVGVSADQAQGSEPVLSVAAHSTFLYPEWNHRANVLRESWCTVKEYATYPLAGQEGTEPLAEAFPPRRLNLRLPLAEGAQMQRRQWQGAELDMDGLIDYLASQRRDGGIDPRVFLDQRPRARTISILLLIDLSASTDDSVCETQTSILALQKRAAIDLARAGRARHDRVAIHGFNSNTRHAVSYQRFLEFDQPFSEAVFARIAMARAEYSTRLGVALRHAAAAVDREKTERRVVIVLTDGAPSDVDVFDPDYLIADAAQAVSEARARGVQTYGLIMDAKAERYAKAVYGLRARQILEYNEDLPRCLSRLYQQLRG